MKRIVRLTYLLCCLILITPVYISAQASSPLLIVELQTRSASVSEAANQEFIEIYNISEDVVDLSKWKLEYKSATGLAWSTKLLLDGQIQPNGRYLLASTNYLTETANQFFSPGLSDTAGHIRLAEKDSVSGLYISREVLGWGITADSPEAMAAPELSAGKSLQRKVDENAQYIDSDNNKTDFDINAVPTPESINVAPQPVIEPTPEPEPDPVIEPEPVPEETLDPVMTPDPVVPPEEPDPITQPEPPSVPEEESQPTPTIELLPLQISELFPNPSAPQTDNADEFVELYNPNEVSVDLNGYVIKTGSNFSYSHLIADKTIPARGFVVFASGETALSLSNTASKARLLSPEGAIVAETVPYEDAPEGQSWILYEGAWSWSTTVTPNEINILTAPVVAEELPKVIPPAKISKPKTVKVTPAPKAASPKVKAASSTKATPKTSKTTSKATIQPVAKTADAFEPEVLPPAIHPLVLAAVSFLALLYAAYEYRHDVANRIYQRRLNRAARRSSR